jgi:tetratricopeptide (TPR) repeat protein
MGNIDKAIELLEKALSLSKEAGIYNRLGVILAMRKKEYARGQELIEKAIELAPKNETYQHNLSKVLARAASAEVGGGGGGGRKNSTSGKKGIFGFFKK